MSETMSKSCVRVGKQEPVEPPEPSYRNSVATWSAFANSHHLCYYGGFHSPIYGLTWFKYGLIPLIIILSYLAGWWFQPTPLKNDGVRQWEGRHPIY